MNKLTTGVAAAALLVASSLSALAANVTGAIVTVDVEAHSVTLDDGKTYVLPEDFDVSVLKPGLEVTLTWENVDGRREVSAVSAPG